MTLTLGLNSGLDFVDLNNLQGLRKLDEFFLNFLRNHSYSLYQTILSLRTNPEQVDQKHYSDFLLEISPIFDDFLAELFGIEQEIANIKLSHREFDIIYECKRKFVQRVAVKKYPYEKLQEIDFASVSNSLEKLLKVGCHPCGNDKNDFTNKFAHQVVAWQLDEKKYAFELDIAAKYAAFMVYNNVESQLFSLPKKIDKDNLIDLDKVAKYRNHARIGFDYLDSTSNLDTVLNNTHYCIYCHKQEKDSCSKGLLYSNDLKNWNVKQGVSERSVVNLREHANTPKFYGGNSSKHLSIQYSKPDDPKEVVIDEVVGQMLTIILSCLSVFFINYSELTKYLSSQLINFIFLFALPFALFRFFDIIKPWPINWLDANIKGGIGIMLDDIAAAIFASVIHYAITFTLIDWFG